MDPFVVQPGETRKYLIDFVKGAVEFAEAGVVPSVSSDSQAIAATLGDDNRTLTVVGSETVFGAAHLTIAATLPDGKSLSQVFPFSVPAPDPDTITLTDVTGADAPAATEAQPGA